MLVKNPRHEITAVSPKQYPENTLPEVAFVGRSNVGKSSLLNILVNRKNLARTGGTPGKTRQINFFNIDDTIYFVDLPGYGYAKVSKQEKESWGKLAETYLTTRNQLKLILMLVDIRHKPTADDKLMFEWIMASGIKAAIVATKLDKIKNSERKSKLLTIRQELGLEDEIKIIPFSALKRVGIEELWELIDEKLLNTEGE